MTKVLETIPQELQMEVAAALAWFNTQESASFEVTGIIDPPVNAASGQELRLILYGEGLCLQRTFTVSGSGDNPLVQSVDINLEENTTPIAELDPPPGALKQWLTEVTDKHSFAVLLFYRGFW